MINIFLGKFDHDQTLFSRSLEIMVNVREIIPSHGRKIQISEIWEFFPVICNNYL